MKPAEIQAVVQFARVALKVVSERSLTLLGMVICAVLFGWVLMAPDLIRLAAASLFAMIVYWPLVRLEKAKQEQPPQGADS